MIIIFLDIDGVVTSARTGFFNMDIYTVNFLRWICEKTGAKIVISSTWRYNHGKQFWKDIFGEYLHEDFKTPDLTKKRESGIWTNVTRGQEIQAWLDRGLTYPEKYLILDDDTDMLPHQKDHFIQTDSTDGMLTEHIIKVREYFGIKDFFNEYNEIFQHPNMFAVNNLKRKKNENINFG